MDDLVQFLRDRLDEDEQSAEQAAAECGADWRCDGDRGYVVARREDDMVATGSQDHLDPAHGDHIARQDPARVLREVEAKRRILRAHAKWCEGRCEAKYPEGGFDAAHYWSIKALAAVYDGHPDYRPEWRP